MNLSSVRQRGIAPPCPTVRFSWLPGITRLTAQLAPDRVRHRGTQDPASTSGRRRPAAGQITEVCSPAAKPPRSSTPVFAIENTANTESTIVDGESGEGNDCACRTLTGIQPWQPSPDTHGWMSPAGLTVYFVDLPRSRRNCVDLRHFSVAKEPQKLDERRDLGVFAFTFLAVGFKARRKFPPGRCDYAPEAPADTQEKV